MKLEKHFLSNQKKVISLLCCPQCKSKLTFSKRIITCSVCERRYKREDEIINFTENTTLDLKLSLKKWNSFYEQQIKNEQYAEDFILYKSKYFPSAYRQINEVKKFKNSIYLEIGCGAFFFGQLVANQCNLIIGTDISPKALVIAKEMLKRNKIKNYILVQADILHLPIATNSVDIIFGSGVIEHFADTKQCLLELYRVLKRKGLCFNSVPMLNVGSLTYRQIWGNIPNAPLLKQVAEFLHIKVLRARHMKFGYELSFLPSTIISLHKQVGFSRIVVKRFEVRLVFEFIPRLFRPVLIFLAERYSIFWPMIKVIAFK